MHNKHMNYKIEGRKEKIEGRKEKREESKSERVKRRMARLKKRITRKEVQGKLVGKKRESMNKQGKLTASKNPIPKSKQGKPSGKITTMPVKNRPGISGQKRSIGGIFGGKQHSLGSMGKY